jgi:hypothetical protein
VCVPPTPLPVNTSKVLIGASVSLLVLAAVFGFLNSNKTRTLRAEAIRNDTARQEAERRIASREKQFKAREAALTAAHPKQAAAEQTTVANAEADLIKSQSEKEELHAKLRANEAEIVELKKRIAGTNEPTVVAGAPPPPSSAELQSQLTEAKKQLDAAEREKSLLSDKMSAAQQHSTQLETEKKRRVATTGNPGVRATVLAVNQAYNFVVLNLGGRHGIEANSEMLVLRGGTLIGKIRISSVEPATAIGDILTNSLARGVQVQPGDIVIYAGSNS